MSKFYGTVDGNGNTLATRRGFEYIETSAQSWDGSVIVNLRYNDKEDLIVRIKTSDGSSNSGDEVLFEGTFERFKKIFKK